MGAHSFTTTVATTDDVHTAYKTAVADAGNEYGHNPYNGSIATTEGVGHVHKAPVTWAEASRIMEARIENLSKWGPCEAISLVHEEPARYEPLDTKDVTLTVRGDQYGDPATLQALIAKALRVKPDEIENYLTYDPSNRARRVTITPAVVATAPKEKTETRYFILTKDSGLPRWENGYPTQSAARADLASVLNYRGFQQQVGPVDAEIVSMTRRVTGEPLVAATVYAKSVEATFTVRLRKKVKAATRGTSHSAWLFYGWAAT